MPRKTYSDWSRFCRQTKAVSLLLKGPLVCYTAVFSVVTQLVGGALRDDTKNGCVAD